MPRVNGSILIASREGLPAQDAVAATPSAAWYVIHTHSRHEVQVEMRLQQMGLEIFLPRIITPSRRRDRKVLLQLPLFPGYLFIHADLETAIYRDILKVQGVVRVLGVKGRLQPLPEATVESIRCLVASGRPYSSWPFLKKGRSVRIIDGPLTGVVGIVINRLEKKRKLVVSVELFRRAVAVELEDESVEPSS